MGDDLNGLRTHESEVELLTRARTGDEAAWTSLLKPLRARLLPVILRTIKDESEAEDLVQETLKTVFIEVNNFRGEARFLTWAWGVAQNKAAKLLRSKMNRQRILRQHANEDPPAMSEPALTPETLAADLERMSDVKKALARLTARERNLILRPLAEGISDPECVPDCEAHSTARVALYRARQKLWAMLDFREDDR